MSSLRARARLLAAATAATALTALPFTLSSAHAAPAQPAAASTASAPSTSPATLAATPPMGWNDWAHYQCAINEQTITSNADALVSSGLAAKGYKTVTIDDCWMASARDSTGHLVADPAKDLWTGTTSTVSSSLTATIPAHGTAVWRLTPGAGCAAAVPTGQITGNGAKCMDVTGSGTADGTPVILYSCSGNSNQRWTQPGDGTFHSLGKCLTASGTPAGSYAVLSSCTGAAVQNWTVKGDGTAANGSSGLCLDVYGGGTADLTKIDTWSCGNHQANQAWALPV